MSVAAPPERRIATRYKPAFGTVCRIGPGRPTVGLVWNISETGVSFVTGNPPEPGETRPAELGRDGEEDRTPVWLKVVYVTPEKTGDYRVGAEFTRRLTEDEVEHFVAPPDERSLPRKG